MIISNEIFESNRRLKESMKNTTNEVDLILYGASRRYINAVEKDAQRVSEVALERAVKIIKQ